MKVKDILSEPFRIQHITPKRGTLSAEAAFQLKYVGLDNSYLENILRSSQADKGSVLQLRVQ